MAPPVPSSLKSQELGVGGGGGSNNHHRSTGSSSRPSDDEDQMADEDMEDMEEFEAEEALLMDEEEEAASSSSGGRKNNHGRPGRQSAPLPITVGGEFKCSVCDFTTRSRVTLQRHERLTHLKKKVFFL